MSVHAKDLAASVLDGALADGAHLVEFYEQDDFLVASVCEFIAPALHAGEAAIIVATEEHRTAFERALTDAGVDVASARADGRLLVADAAEMLATFMADLMPDGQRFESTIGALIADAARAGRGVRIYGEMVALLWAEGNVAAAIALEGLWNQLAVKHPFSLFCAYPMHLFDRQASTDPFRSVCAAHSSVIPSERYWRAPDAGERMRTVALLEQAANAGATEAEQLRAKQAQLEDALRRLEDLTRTRNEFVGMVVHDIRSPATVVAGFLETLRANWRTLDAAIVDEFLARAVENSKQIQLLTDDILTVSHLNTGEFRYDIREFDLAEVVYRAIGSVRDTNPSAAIEAFVPAQLPRAFGDPARQMQILNNLLSNALKFSAPGSPITVHVEHEADLLVARVTDRGVGIAAEDLAQLFQPFSRLRAEGYEGVKGTGLGLYITRSLVEGQGGTMTVTSTPGEGSTFSYTVRTAT